MYITYRILPVPILSTYYIRIHYDDNIIIDNQYNCIPISSVIFVFKMTGKIKYKTERPFHSRSVLKIITLYNIGILAHTVVDVH